MFITFFVYSVKQFTPTEPCNIPKPKKEDLEAGAELLETWQNNWEVIHLNNERNAKKADKCDKLIVNIKDRTLKQWNDIATLQTHIPQINNGIKDIMDKLGSLESFIGDVEISLLALEDTIDAREMQEKQLDQRFQLAMYQERRKAEFNDLASKYLKVGVIESMMNFKFISDRLQNEYEKKKKLHSEKKSVDSAKLQKHYQSKFDEDVKNFQDGNNRLQVPLRHDPDASLESVDLDDPDEAATNTLEAFLNEPDALYDVSPLPRDETPLQKTDDVDQVLTEVPINVVNTESPDTNNTPAGSQVVSGSASLYFTPDVTTEQLSEISLQ